ncbi:hypothetical protein CDAR_123911 [Caerostris darwini]|uniref:Uncharacterized protein n=1 Tax=Caerostris darwini TaxID=1538125 RepID=A0AAV4M6Z5_9ARAC|nr:hypothetical protein CDAR_123911 [Caerostris darwini]
MGIIKSVNYNVNPLGSKIGVKKNQTPNDTLGKTFSKLSWHNHTPNAVFSSRKPHVTQCSIIISSGSSAPSRKQQPSVAEQQSHSRLAYQMMKPESPFCEWCSYRSALLIA